MHSICVLPQSSYNTSRQCTIATGCRSVLIHASRLTANAVYIQQTTGKYSENSNLRPGTWPANDAQGRPHFREARSSMIQSTLLRPIPSPPPFRGLPSPLRQKVSDKTDFADFWLVLFSVCSTIFFLVLISLFF